MSHYTAPEISIPNISGKTSPLFNPENVSALSEEEKKTFEGLVNEEEC